MAARPAEGVGPTFARCPSRRPPTRGCVLRSWQCVQRRHVFSRPVSPAMLDRHDVIDLQNSSWLHPCTPHSGYRASSTRRSAAGIVRFGDDTVMISVPFAHEHADQRVVEQSARHRHRDRADSFDGARLAGLGVPTRDHRVVDGELHVDRPRWTVHTDATRRVGGVGRVRLAPASGRATLNNSSILVQERGLKSAPASGWRRRSAR